MNKIFILLSCAFLLLGCGPKVSGDASKKKTKQPATCPAVTRFPAEEIMIYLANPPPGRVAVEIGGVRKYSECETIKENPSLIRVERHSGNRLFIRMQRQDKTRATEITYAVKKLKDDCSAGEEVFLPEERIELRYNTDYPDGAGCAAQETARMEVIRH